MTTGAFHTLPISDITILRETRQRRDLTKVDELAESISRLGLIHPPVVTREHILVAGERRLEACRSLGWTHIPIQFQDELDPYILECIELEENIKRADISWQDEVRALERLHQIMSSNQAGWTQEKTAKAIGLSSGDVSKKLKVAKELSSGNERIVTAPKFSVARGIVERKEERAAAQEKVTFETAKLTPAVGPASILNADFRQWINTYTGPRFNFIHCDFPYGIGADGFNQGGAAAHGGYEDGLETYVELLVTLANAVRSLASESCHIMFWFSMKHYEMTYENLTQMGFEVDRFPLIWHRSDNSGILPDPSRGPRRIYETALYGSLGDRKVVQSVSNVYAAPTVRDRHMSEKPEPMLRHFFRMFVDEHSVVLDPTCGSGSAIRAAESMKAQSALGLEMNPEFAKLAGDELERARKLRSAA